MTRYRRPLTTALSLLLAAVCLGRSAAGEPVANTKYAPFTIALYNKNVEESRKLAAYYAGKRSIPLDNIIGFDVPPGEIVSRKDYEEQIREPLKAYFEANAWWEREKDARGVLRPTTNKIKFAAIMHGMPLKIAPSPPKPTGETDPRTGKPILTKVSNQTTDSASLDSELMLFGVDLPTLAGPGKNTYFRGNDAFGRPEILLTSRIDGPNYKTAQRLIDDAILTEQQGLWGTGVIDIAKLADQKGPGYAIGDQWLENCALFYHKAGIPTIVDRSPAELPAGYPLGHGEVALYFGWYHTKVIGPFAAKDFRFARGAVAVHLHSLSASSLTFSNRFWTAPLIQRGACASLGNVYEPFLTMTTHFDLFNARLLGGFTLAEAGWMATPTVSWMTIVVGDPLYQPFRRGQKFDMTSHSEFKAYRLAVRNWGADPKALIGQLERAAASMNGGRMHEMTGLYLLGDKKGDLAAAQFAKAKKAYTEPADKLRQDLHRARMRDDGGDKNGAITLLRATAIEFKDTPGAAAAIALANQLDPPPPPPPPASSRSTPK